MFLVPDCGSHMKRRKVIVRALAVITVLVAAVVGWLLWPLVYARFMGWWTGKGGAHYWP